VILTAHGQAKNIQTSIAGNKIQKTAIVSGPKRDARMTRETVNDSTIPMNESCKIPKFLRGGGKVLREPLVTRRNHWRGSS